MDIKDKLTEQDKQQLQGLALECQVLNNLLGERRAILQSKAEEILARLDLSPKLYNMKFNPGKNLWEAELKAGAIVLPNQGVKQNIER